MSKEVYTIGRLANREGTICLGSSRLGLHQSGKVGDDCSMLDAAMEASRATEYL